MNVILSVNASTRKGKGCFVIECNSVIYEKAVISLPQGHINSRTAYAHVLKACLPRCKGYINHNMNLIISVPTSSIYKWLSCESTNRDNEEDLLAIFDILEGIDCRYKFVLNNSLYTRKLLEEGISTKLKGSSLSDVMSEFN